MKEGSVGWAAVMAGRLGGIAEDGWRRMLL